MMINYKSFNNMILRFDNTRIKPVYVIELDIHVHEFAFYLFDKV